MANSRLGFMRPTRPTTMRPNSNSNVLSTSLPTSTKPKAPPPAAKAQSAPAAAVPLSAYQSNLMARTSALLPVDRRATFQRDVLTTWALQKDTSVGKFAQVVTGSLYNRLYEMSPA